MISAAVIVEPELRCPVLPIDEDGSGLPVVALTRQAAFRLGIRPVTNLIDTSNVYSLIVVVLAGVVGTVSLTYARTSTLLGLFIAVTTIPAASDIGVAVAFGSWSEARGFNAPVAAQRRLADRGRLADAEVRAPAVAADPRSPRPGTMIAITGSRWG
jgi:hypothetical protein